MEAGLTEIKGDHTEDNVVVSDAKRIVNVVYILCGHDQRALIATRVASADRVCHVDPNLN